MKKVSKNSSKYNGEENAHKLSSNLGSNGILVVRLYSETDRHGHFFYDNFDKYVSATHLDENEYKEIIKDYVNAFRYLHE